MWRLQTVLVSCLVFLSACETGPAGPVEPVDARSNKIEIEVGRLEAAIVFLGEAVSGTSAGCNLSLELVPVAGGETRLVQGGCGTLIADDLPVGDYSATLYHGHPGDEVAPTFHAVLAEDVGLSVEAGATTLHTFEVGHVLGAVTGTVLVNGEMADPASYRICGWNDEAPSLFACTGPAFGTGHFSLLLLPGPGTGQVTGMTGHVLATFTFNVRAGTAEDVGNPLNGDPELDVGGPYQGLEGTPLAFTLSASDPDGDPLTFTWAFGDGTTGSGSALPGSHTYLDAGSYELSVTADDGQGGVVTATAAVEVLTPVMLAGWLVDRIEALAADGLLTKAQATSMGARVEAAIRQMDASRFSVAARQLVNLAEDVRRLAEQGKIGEAVAAEIVGVLDLLVERLRAEAAP